MERWPWYAACMSAVTPVAAACSRPKAEDRPPSVGRGQSASTDPPSPSHLTTFCSSPRSADS
eukprot:scaffold62063_cov65-Phaeocystis_antarctica.AAC.9